MKRKTYKPSVSWTLPGKKKPFAYSHPAVSCFLAVMAESYETFQDVYDNILYDSEEKEIVKYFIDHGLGDKIAKEYIR
jgi:hypothetical protein